jgi:ligand-binding sensor domain-containing protein
MNKVMYPTGFRIVFFFIIISVLALGIGASAATLPGRTFTSFNSVISAMVCDEHYVWGASGADGLIRIDKNTGETSVYPVASPGLHYNSAMTLALDTDSLLLVGTSYGGILRLKGRKLERISALPDSGVWKMTVDGQGKIWAWTQNHCVVRFDAGARQQIVDRFSGTLASDRSGNVWILNLPTNDTVCSEAWIREYANGVLQSSVSITSLCLKSYTSQSLLIDSKKNCWIGTLDKLIKVTGQTIRAFSANTDPNTRAYCSVLALNSDDVLLIAVKTYVSGLFAATRIYLYDQRNDNANPFDSAVMTFSSRYVDAAGCADDRGKCFWLALSNGSIFRIDASRSVTTLTTGNSTLPGNSIAAVLIDKSDNVWAATGNGIARCANTSWTVFPAAGDTFPGTDASCLAMDSAGTIWAGFRQPLVSSMSSTGLSYFGGQNWKMLFRSHISQKAIAIDTSGDMWVVADDGVFKYHDMKAEKLYTNPVSGGYDTTIKTIAFDGGNMPWIGSDGLKKYENGVWTHDTAFSRIYPKSSGHPAPEVMALGFFGNIAWIGTAVGLFKRIGNDFSRIDTADGLLPDPYVQCIMVDGINSAWVGTRRGLTRLNGPNHATYTTENTPLCDNDITACAAARNGDVWIGTRQGGLTVLRRAATATAKGKIPAGRSCRQSVDVSFVTKPHGACRISIRTNKPASIGFSVFSLQGNLIKRFEATPMGVQSIDLAWDGTNLFNRPVSPGIYLGIAFGNGKIIGSTTMRW